MGLQRVGHDQVAEQQQPNMKRAGEQLTGESGVGAGGAGTVQVTASIIGHGGKFRFYSKYVGKSFHSVLKNILITLIIKRGNLTTYDFKTIFRG